MTRLMSMMLVFALVVALPARCARAATKEAKAQAKKAELAQKVKTGIRGLGVGTEAHVDLRRSDGSRVVGYVSRAAETDFTVTNAETGAETQVPYDDVSKVKGNNFATGWKIAIGVGVVFAVLLILVWAGAIGDAER